MTQRSKLRYHTTNWKQYNAVLKAQGSRLKAQGSLTAWLDKRMSWFAATRGKRGRSPTLSEAAIQFCLTLKNLFGLALRQATGLAESVLQLSGLNWPTPDANRHTQCSDPLHTQLSKAALLVDSTGIKFLGEGEWKCKKHRSEYRRQWHKLHIVIDA